MKTIVYNIQNEKKEHLVKANAKKHEFTFISNELNEQTLLFSQDKEAVVLSNTSNLTINLLFSLKEFGIKRIISYMNDSNPTIIQQAYKYKIQIDYLHDIQCSKEKAKKVINQLNHLASELSDNFSNKMDVQKELVRKYNIAAPRYTSYPTVPFWDTNQWDENKWIEKVKITHKTSLDKGISLYIHLPFCESLCTYCGCNTRITKNHKVELPYIMDVLKEWELYKKHLDNDITISDIHLGGGTPTFFAPENLKVLVTTILLGAKVHKDAEFSFEAHPANTTKSHLETLYALGFRRLSLGIQDFDPLVQFIINRKQNEEDISKVMNHAHTIGYTSINFDLIYGLPKQTLQTITNTVNKVIALKPDRISFYSYAHVPWIKPGQRHYNEDDLPTGEEKLQMYELSKEIILNAGYRDIGMDHFSLPDDSLFKAAKNETLHRNFMGYSDRFSPLMIGLGVSSISDSWNAFAQNVKTVEEYRTLLKQNKLPLFKGHIHTEDDLSLRKHILNIMCNGKTVWKHNDPIIIEITKELLPLNDNGLITLHPEGLFVTKIGKSFLRNICMVFDRRLAHNKSKTDIFSKAI